jgi:hypothetical protein
MNFDAVIVLANQMDVNGVLNDESKARAIEAVKIFNNNPSKRLVTCGWDYRKDTKIKIADAFKEYFTNELGVKSDLVIAELNSRDTVGDAYFTKVNLAKPLIWSNLCVVTSDYHVKRTQEIFNFIYGCQFNIKVYGASVDADSSVLSNELSSIKAFKDTFYNVKSGNDEQIFNALRAHHPFYNGDIYEKI